MARRCSILPFGEVWKLGPVGQLPGVLAGRLLDVLDPVEREEEPGPMRTGAPEGQSPRPAAAAPLDANPGSEPLGEIREGLDGDLPFQPVGTVDDADEKDGRRPQSRTRIVTLRRGSRAICINPRI